MRRITRYRPSPAMVVATIALIVALGGSAYAALSGIPDSNGIFHGCVNKHTGALRLVPGAGSCRGIKKHHGRTVFPGEFAIAWNQRGRAGTNGINGTPGGAGATKVVVRSSTHTGGSNLEDVSCNPGEVATGGGGNASGTALIDSEPVPNNAGSAPTGWQMAVTNGSITKIAYVVCASP